MLKVDKMVWRVNNIFTRHSRLSNADILFGNYTAADGFIKGTSPAKYNHFCKNAGIFHFNPPVVPL